MELHQLRYFAAVAELGSFTRAAERCRVAQPSLSQQIAKFERELGQLLFERSGRTIRLTEAGRALYDQAVAILSAVEDMRERATEGFDPARGAVRVGAIPTIAPYFLPGALREFRKRYPLATLALHEDVTERTIRDCLEGEIDLGIVATPAPGDRLESEELFTEELLLALPPRHPLTRKKAIAFADIAALPFVLLSEMHCLGAQVIDFCENQGCSPAVHCRSAQLLTIQELVAQGQGVSLVPASACALDRGRRCAYRSLAGQKPTRTIRMAWRRHRRQSPLLQAFMMLLREHASAVAP